MNEAYGVDEIYTVTLPPSSDEPLSALQRVLAYMQEHLAEVVTVPMLASVAGCSASHLAATFRRNMGESPHRYLIRLRVEKARTLLRQGISPAQTAVSVGFYDHSHLSRRMRQVLGVSPAGVRSSDAGESAGRNLLLKPSLVVEATETRGEESA